MFTHEVQLRVRYADTDQMGYVYYGNYAAYFEVARVEAFRSLGYSYKELEAEGIGMPVLELKTRYHSPGRYDDLLTINVRIPDLPSARIKFEYEISNESGTLCTSGETTLVFINMQTGKPVRAPKQFISLIEKYF